MTGGQHRKLWSCNLCAAKGDEFMVPADEIGVELMKAHMLDKHGITIPLHVGRS